MSLCKTVNQLVSDYFFSEQLLAQRDKVEKTSKDDIKLWGESNMWAMADVESDTEGGIVYKTLIWRTEECSATQKHQNGGSQILSQKTNTLISSVQTDIISKDKYLD